MSQLREVDFDKINAMAIEAMGSPEEHIARISAVSELLKSIGRGKMNPALERIAQVNQGKEWVEVANIKNQPGENVDLNAMTIAISPKNPGDIQVKWGNKSGSLAQPITYRLANLAGLHQETQEKVNLIKSLVGAGEANEYFGFAAVREGKIITENRVPSQPGDTGVRIMSAPNTLEEQLYYWRTDSASLTQDSLKEGIIAAMKIPPMTEL